MNDLSKRFHHYFDVLTANDSAVADAAFRLRYQVYCLETGFEDQAAFTDQRERDAFDRWSVHGVIRHRTSTLDTATVRLVRAVSDTSRASFPIEQQYPEFLTRHGLDEAVLPRTSTAEISRFAVSKRMKRRWSDTQETPSGVSNATAQQIVEEEDFNNRRCPLVTFGLFLALVRLTAANDITHWIAVMEPPLLRLLARFGIKFIPIGGVIDYHGRRQPCYGEVASVLEGIHDTHPDLWHLITDGGASSFESRTPAFAQVAAAR